MSKIAKGKKIGDFEGTVSKALAQFNSSKGIKRGFTFVIKNDTDQEVTDTVLAVEHEDGSGGIYGGGKIAPRTTFQWSVDIVPCVLTAMGTAWFGKERVDLPASTATPGYCLIGAEWEISYTKLNGKTISKISSSITPF